MNKEVEEANIQILNSDDYIPKQKIIDIFDIKIHNFKTLAETDWYEDTKQIDYQIADILKIILQELLEEGE